ncbi:MAG: hypothetical protein MJD61_20965, partial [Proteobacteria bacterium]|nr:hypothetical protein [Pseudomonadota bacterium]
MKHASVMMGCLLVAFSVSCGRQQAPVNRVGVNVLEKSLLEGRWYMSSTVIDLDYAGSALGTFPGDMAGDLASGYFVLPKIRWIIDEDTLFAYRDYAIIEGGEVRRPGQDPTKASGYLGQPVAAYAIESHFDIRREYNPVTGEELNVVVENDQDRRWYERQFMRVDWSRNLLPGYFGQTKDLYEVFGLWQREPAALHVQDASKLPEAWRPGFHRMSCAGPGDSECAPSDRDWAGDYEQGELYHFSFVTQDLLSPAEVTDPVTGQQVNFCRSSYTDAPNCSVLSAFVRNSFRKLGEQRQYEPENWVDTRHERYGYFRLERLTFDRSSAAADPHHGFTDFLNYNVLRHNIWQRWRSDAGEPIPYEQRQVRPIVWYTTPELPAHLVKPSFELVARWNEALMDTV